MPGISITRSFRIYAFACLIFLHFVTGLSEDTPSNNQSNSTSSTGTGTKVFITCLAILIVFLLGLLLFKLWQKKKREEQYARLLKLFEEDDELEVELGLRD